MNEIKKVDGMINEFTGLIKEGIEAWQKAGLIVVDLIDGQGESCSSLAEKSGLGPGIIGRFEQLGRKQLMPYLLMVDWKAAKYLVRLPYSEQKRLEHGSVELLIENESGVDTIQVPVRNLEPEQCKQVFCREGVRDLAAQRSYLVERRSSERLKAVREVVGSQSEPYQIGRKNTVIISRPCELSRRELLRILEDMES